MQATSQKNRTIMSIIAIVIGLVMAYVIPFMVQTSLERVLFHLNAHIEKGFPAFSSGLPLFDFFYSVWQAVIFAAGAALIIISLEIKKGTEWSYPLALSLFALPSIGGFFMFLPYISWVPGFPMPMIIAFVGLTGYWAFIFLRKGERVAKWVQAGAPVDIDIVQADGGMANARLTGAGLANIDVFPFENIGSAGFVNTNGLGHGLVPIDCLKV